MRHAWSAGRGTHAELRVPFHVLADGSVEASFPCPHCRHMAPVLTRLHDVYGNRVYFLTVAFDRRVTRVRAFAQVHGHPWCYLLGDDNTVRAYALEGVPTFVLLGPDGRIRGVQVGSCAYDELARAIEALIGPP